MCTFQSGHPYLASQTRLLIKAVLLDSAMWRPRTYLVHACGMYMSRCYGHLKMRHYTIKKNKTRTELWMFYKMPNVKLAYLLLVRISFNHLFNAFIVKTSCAYTTISDGIEKIFKPNIRSNAQRIPALERMNNISFHFRFVCLSLFDFIKNK